MAVSDAAYALMTIGMHTTKAKWRRAADQAAALSTAAEDRKLYIGLCVRNVQNFKANLGQAEYDRLLLHFTGAKDVSHEVSEVV